MAIATPRQAAAWCFAAIGARAARAFGLQRRQRPSRPSRQVDKRKTIPLGPLLRPDLRLATHMHRLVYTGSLAPQLQLQLIPCTAIAIAIELQLIEFADKQRASKLRRDWRCQATVLAALAHQSSTGVGRAGVEVTRQAKSCPCVAREQVTAGVCLARATVVVALGGRRE